MRGREQLCSYETFNQFVGMFFNPICRLGHGLHIFQVHCIDLSENIGLCLYKPAVCKENGLRGFRQTISESGVSATSFGTFLLFLFKAHLVIFTVALFLVWLLVRLTRCARRCPTWNSVTKNREDFGGGWWQVSESRQKFIVYYSVALLVGANCQVIS